MTHLTIRALLKELPKEIGPWEKIKKLEFLEAFQKLIDLLYPDAEGDNGNQ